MMLSSFINKIGLNQKRSDLFLVLAVIFILFLLVIPLNGYFIDALISVNIFLSITTLLITLYTYDTLAFSSFPAFLLFLTLFRLGLNIATTRMILTQAHAGEIIKTFGDVVTGGNQLVGFILFILLTGVNFLVITKGSGRVAEVAARFTLDSLPGKQLSIDADVSAGLIDEQEAKRQRSRIMQEADFYGAMDGASKFVRGDAMASLIIIFVNMIGGFIVGMGMHHLNWKEVVDVYVTLTVGDGLVTQIPALLVSVAAGIIVTRSSAKENLAEALRKQMFNNPRLLTVTALILLMLGCIPGMPLLVMAPIAIIIIAYAYHLTKKQDHLNNSESIIDEKEPQVKTFDEIKRIFFVDPMEIEIGKNLIPIVDETNKDHLIGRITDVRLQIASELGIIVPAVRIHDSTKVDPNHYIIKIKGNEVANGTLLINKLLAINPSSISPPELALETVDPTYNLQAFWIDPDQKDSFIRAGFIVADALSVLTTHLLEVIRSYSYDLIDRQEVSKLIDQARHRSSAALEEIIPTKLNLGQILKVLQNLLKEKISIRDFPSIIELVANHTTETTDPDLLSEFVRQGLARSITKQYTGADKTLYFLSLDQRVEQILIDSIEKSDSGKRIVVPPETLYKILSEIDEFMQNSSIKGIKPVFLTSPALRPYFKKLIERYQPKLAVLSYYEITPETTAKNLGVISSNVLMQD
jgi:flagellar biosynthesis protein FlhA